MPGQDDHIPGFLGGDLPEPERLAYEEGHDADIPSNKVVIRPIHDAPRASPLNKDVDSDVEKGESTPSISDGAGDRERRDEKAQPTAETDEDETNPNVIFWDGPDDPANPLNWKSSSKWAQIAVLSALTLLTPLASSMFAPGVPQLMKDFKSDNVSLATFVVSVYILGFAAGPVVIAPMSELYGRVIVYHICNFGFIAFTIGCAFAQTLNQLIVFRFFAGCLGVAPLTNGGGTIADLMEPKQRGAAMAIWAIGPLMGPVIGPVAGGYLAQATSWRWVFYVLAMASGVFTLAALVVLRETYGPTILERKVKRMRKETGNMSLRSKLDLQLGPRELFILAITRPTKLLFLSPICAAMSMYMAFVYAVLYLLFTTFAFVFEKNYGFSSGTVGLVYIGTGIGMLLGLAFLGATSDKFMKRLADKHNGGTLKPEYRLPMLIYASPAIPIGLFIYGWGAEKHVQWAVPLLGTVFVGIGLIAAFMCINTYLIDAFTRYAASAMAASTILRSVLGATFPLFGLQMYSKLGLGWGNSLLAFIALALCPIPVLFYRYGETLRTHPRFQVKL